MTLSTPSTSFFASLERIPKDAIFALTAEYLQDPSEKKVNLGQGTYRDENGQPWVLPSVSAARDRLAQDLKHEYLPILGHAEFREATAQAVLGPGIYTSRKTKVASCQSLSGTGALHLAGLLLARSRASRPKIYVPEPTWSNHIQVFSTLGFECVSFRYYDAESRSLDAHSYLSTLRAAEPGSAVILHACAHNPTGCDPSREQWHRIGEVMKERQLFPIFDSAYLGFNSGDFDNDAWPIRHFVDDLDMEAVICVSFAKNMGLYGERTGCILALTTSEDVAANTSSVLEQLQRSEVSNPPAYGAKIAHAVLSDEKLRGMWHQDLVTMSGRIKTMRQTLYEGLLSNDTPGDWTHLIRQSGMFGFLGLSPAVVKKLKETYHIYMADNSRISIAGLNDSNVAYVAGSIAECLRG